jgi:hypothetical protein
MFVSSSRATAFRIMRHLGRTAGVCLVLLSLSAAPALADPGGVPHGSPDTCGVGSAEAHEFIDEATNPGASEINAFPPVAFGCTGKN